MRQKLKNAKNLPELTWLWQNKPWYTCSEGGLIKILYRQIKKPLKKSRIWETLNLSTDADSISIAMKREKKLNRGIYIFLNFFFAVNIFWGGFCKQKLFFSFLCLALGWNKKSYWKPNTSELLSTSWILGHFCCFAA